MIFNLDVFANENKVKYNLKWSSTPNHLYRHDKSPTVLP